MAAFSSDDTGGDGNLEVVFEIRKANVKAKDIVNVVNLVHNAIIEDIGLIPTRVVAIKERSILKTTSGKIQRKATRKALHNGNLKVLHEYKVGEQKMKSAMSQQNQIETEIQCKFCSC